VADLTVDYQILEASERMLASLHQQLASSTGAGGVADQEWGHNGVVGAVGQFRGNWSYHREQIMGRMQALGTMATQSRQSFQAADSKLKSTLAKAGGHHGAAL
jgi:hypothetical protein